MNNKDYSFFVSCVGEMHCFGVEKDSEAAALFRGRKYIEGRFCPECVQNLLLLRKGDAEMCDCAFFSQKPGDPCFWGCCYLKEVAELEGYRMPSGLRYIPVDNMECDPYSSSLCPEELEAEATEPEVVIPPHTPSGFKTLAFAFGHRD